MKPMVPKVGQMSMIVDNALEYAKRYNDDFGIGPWHFLHFDETNMTGMSDHGKPVPLFLMEIINRYCRLIGTLCR
jgi:hypothetical protein